MKQDPPTGMRAPLKWGLVGTVAATAASLLWPTHELVGAQDHEGQPAAAAPPARQVAAAPPAYGTVPDGSRRVGPLFESDAAPAPSPFDPFVGVVAPPPPAPPPVAPPVAAVAPAPPPPQDYRFLGRVTDPDGVEQILLGRGDMAVPVKVGTALDNGYVVESITPDAIVLAYPPLGIKTTLLLPKPDA